MSRSVPPTSRKRPLPPDGGRGGRFLGTQSTGAPRRKEGGDGPPRPAPPAPNNMGNNPCLPASVGKNRSGLLPRGRGFAKTIFPPETIFLIAITVHGGSEAIKVALCTLDGANDVGFCHPCGVDPMFPGDLTYLIDPHLVPSCRSPKERNGSTVSRILRTSSAESATGKPSRGMRTTGRRTIPTPGSAGAADGDSVGTRGNLASIGCPRDRRSDGWLPKGCLHTVCNISPGWSRRTFAPSAKIARVRSLHGDRKWSSR